MSTLVIHMPADLANASKDAARKLGVSRASLIRTALAHELKHLNARFEQEAMAKSLVSMEADKTWLQEAEGIENGLNAPLPEDEGGWWKTQP